MGVCISFQKRLGKAQKAIQPNHSQQQESQLLIFAGNPKKICQKACLSG